MANGRVGVSSSFIRLLFPFSDQHGAVPARVRPAESAVPGRHCTVPTYGNMPHQESGVQGLSEIDLYLMSFEAEKDQNSEGISTARDLSGLST